MSISNEEVRSINVNKFGQNNNNNESTLPILTGATQTPKQQSSKQQQQRPLEKLQQQQQQILPEIQISCQTTQPNTITNNNSNAQQQQSRGGVNQQFYLSDNKSVKSVNSNHTNNILNTNSSTSNNRSQLNNIQPSNFAIKDLQSTTQSKKNTYNQEDLRQLLELFNTFDISQIGLITTNYLHQILNKLSKESPFIDDIIMRIAITKEGYVSFDEFLAIITEIEKTSAHGKNNKSQPVQADPKVIEFLRLLDEYRKKCENEGNYAEAKKAHLKIIEIKQKEQLRQKNNLRFVQEEELVNIEQLQKNQFEEFTKAWDNYMAEYEATAYLSLEKLKEKHLKEIEDYTNELREDLYSKIKYSKQLIELRHKEKVLVKLKNYNEAETIKSKADHQEDYETKQKEAEIEEKIEMKVQILRKNQSQLLQALLKRIQADRTHQLKQRQLDSNRLIMKNRNIRNELVHKHNNEVKKAVDILKENLHFHENQLENLKKHFRQAQINPTEKEKKSTSTEENSLYKVESTNKNNIKVKDNNNTNNNNNNFNHLQRHKRSTSLQQNLSHLQIKPKPPPHPPSGNSRTKGRDMSVNGRKYRQRDDESKDNIMKQFNKQLI